MSSYDSETLNVVALGFPVTGYSLGIDSNGNIYSTNNSNGSKSTIYMTYLTSLTTGTFYMGVQYSMTAVFSNNLLASPVITPPNSSDSITNSSYTGNTLTFKWTPSAVVSNIPFQFQIYDITISSGGYTTYSSTNSISSVAYSAKIASSTANNLTVTFKNNLLTNPTVTPPNGSITNEGISSNVCTFTWTPSSTNVYAAFNGSSYWTLIKCNHSDGTMHNSILG